MFEIRGESTIGKSVDDKRLVDDSSDAWISHGMKEKSEEGGLGLGLGLDLSRWGHLPAACVSVENTPVQAHRCDYWSIWSSMVFNLETFQMQGCALVCFAEVRKLACSLCTSRERERDGLYRF